MSSATPTVWVCSATGSQGLAVARQLRELGWIVHAIVRDPSSAAAKALAALGAKLTVGDWDNLEALETSIANCEMLFLNMLLSFDDIHHEPIQALRILRIAKAAGVKHVIYSSGVSSDAPEKRTLLPVESIAARSLFNKNLIEGLVQRGGFHYWTILRGGIFMANFLKPKIMMYPDLLKTNVWTTALTPETLLPMVDHNDIAKFAVAAFREPQRFDKKGIEIAAEFLSPATLMEQLSAANGRNMQAAFLTEDDIKAQSAKNPFIAGQLASRDGAKLVDLNKVKSWGIPLTTFREFLARETRAIQETYQ